MPKITLEIPEELSDQLTRVGDRLPELLALSLKQPVLSAHIYYYILNFITSNPNPEEIAAFSPTLEMQQRLRTLLERDRAGELTAAEHLELDEYERIEHLVIMFKAGNLPNLSTRPSA
jgi:hypothetical protein